MQIQHKGREQSAVFLRTVCEYTELLNFVILWWFDVSIFLYLNNYVLWLILDIRPPRKIQKATASKIKKAGSSKRQRDSDDSDDVDYAPNPSDLAAASSVGGVGDESLEKYVEGVEDDVTDLMGLDLSSRQWTAESYANARSVNQLNMPRDINILYFKTEVQKMLILVI